MSLEARLPRNADRPTIHVVERYWKRSETEPPALQREELAFEAAPVRVLDCRGHPEILAELRAGGEA